MRSNGRSIPFSNARDDDLLPASVSLFWREEDFVSYMCIVTSCCWYCALNCDTVLRLTWAELKWSLTPSHQHTSITPAENKCHSASGTGGRQATFSGTDQIWHQAHPHVLLLKRDVVVAALTGELENGSSYSYWLWTIGCKLSLGKQRLGSVVDVLQFAGYFLKVSLNHGSWDILHLLQKHAKTQIKPVLVGDKELMRQIIVLLEILIWFLQFL